MKLGGMDHIERYSTKASAYIVTKERVWPVTMHRIMRNGMDHFGH